MHKYYENTILSNDYTIVYVDEVKTSLPCEERWKVREIRRVLYSDASFETVITCWDTQERASGEEQRSDERRKTA